MTDIVHTDVFDKGLSELVGVTLSVCITQTEPLTRADCTGVSGSGGKRITSEGTFLSGDITLVDGLNVNSRKLIIPVKHFTNGVQVAVDTGVADYWLAIYDGTRLLFKSDSLVNRTLNVGETVSTPETPYEFRQ